MSSTVEAEPAEVADPSGATAVENGPARSLLHRLPANVRASFSAEQVAALEAAAAETGWYGHPVNLRLTIPTVLNRYYLVVLGGRERRADARLAKDRRRHPLLTRANFAFLLLVGGLALYFIFVLLTMLFSALLAPAA